MRSFNRGVYPVMLTPFTEDNQVDYESLGRLVDWYIEKGVDGLFADCQSSEMFFLSLEERLKIAEFVVKAAAGRVPVVASGHVSEKVEDQITELQKMAETGIDALILITNRLAKKEEDDDVWMNNLRKVMDALPEELPLGFYECPYPYKRLITPEELAWCAATSRFYFIKDTSCSLDDIQKKLDIIRGSTVLLFNANTSTLLETLHLGAAGFSGVMANFHPELYVWLVENAEKEPEKARRLADFLTVASLIERQIYPVNAKYFHKTIHNFRSLQTRTKDPALLNDTGRLEVDQLICLTEDMKKYLGICQNEKLCD